MNELIAFFWLLCHEEFYRARDHHHAMLSCGRVVKLNKAGQVLEEVAPSALWAIPDLPVVGEEHVDPAANTYGIVVDPEIAKKLRSTTSVLLGENSNEYPQ